MLGVEPTDRGSDRGVASRSILWVGEASPETGSGGVLDVEPIKHDWAGAVEGRGEGIPAPPSLCTSRTDRGCMTTLNRQRHGGQDFCSTAWEALNRWFDEAVV